MLIPSIDLSGGRIVQLVQGERLAIATDDVDLWMERLSPFPLVQLIDLDAARGMGSNDALVGRVLGALPCRVGGGVRTVDRARALIDAGAREIIVGSALFPGGRPDAAAARAFAAAIGLARTVAAVDSRGGRVVVKGWREEASAATADAIRALDADVGAFLYTHVETEGLMGGIDMTAVRAARSATRKRFAAAGGITTREEIDELEAIGADAVVGMALYTGRLPLQPFGS
jgi:phosphoribosylformimino-5-aminoimidazole carboxamide ribotide isomerase